MTRAESREIARTIGLRSQRNEAAPIDEDELAHLLQESVQLHLASDVPLGVFLSGGVDSSAVANLAQKAAGRSRKYLSL